MTPVSAAGRRARVLYGSLLVLAVLGMVGSIGLTLRTTQKLSESIASVSHTHRVLRQINGLWGALGDRDTQVLRYLLTGRDENLQAFRHGVREFDASAARLAELVADNPAQRGLLAELHAVHGERLRRNEELIALKQRAVAGDRGAIATLDSMFVGPPATRHAEAMREVLDRMVEVETGLLATRRAQREQMIAQNRKVVLSATTLALVAGCAALLALRRLRRRAEEALRASVEAAQAHKASQARQALVDLVSHDLRQHLGNVEFSLGLLPTAADDGTRRELVERAAGSARAGLLFLEAVLVQAAGEARDGPDPLISPAAAVRETAQGHAQAAQQKDMSFELRLDDTLRIRARPAVLLHVLGNLLSNAIKYGAPGTPVTVELDAHGGRARLRVSDHGPGVGEHERASLFRRFAPLSARPTGGEAATGLGLASARQRVRAQGGDLRYEDRPGGGARFVVEWPLA